MTPLDHPINSSHQFIASCHYFYFPTTKSPQPKSLSSLLPQLGTFYKKAIPPPPLAVQEVNLPAMGSFDDGTSAISTHTLKEMVQRKEAKQKRKLRNRPKNTKKQEEEEEEEEKLSKPYSLVDISCGHSQGTLTS